MFEDSWFSDELETEPELFYDFLFIERRESYQSRLSFLKAGRKNYSMRDFIYQTSSESDLEICSKGCFLLFDIAAIIKNSISVQLVKEWWC